TGWRGAEPIRILRDDAATAVGLTITSAAISAAARIPVTRAPTCCPRADMSREGRWFGGGSGGSADACCPSWARSGSVGVVTSEVVWYPNDMHSEPLEPGRIVARLARQIEVALAKVDLTLSQYRVLIHLCEGREAASGLADKLAVSRPSITGVVDGLVA